MDLKGIGILFFLFTGVVFTQEWKSISPPGGHVTSIYINPDNANIVSVTTNDYFAFIICDKGLTSWFDDYVVSGIISLSYNLAKSQTNGSKLFQNYYSLFININLHPFPIKSESFVTIIKYDIP